MSDLGVRWKQRLQNFELAEHIDRVGQELYRRDAD